MTTATLAAANSAYAIQQGLAAAAVAAAKRVEGRGSQAVAQAVAAYQLLAAQQGAASVAPIMAEQGLSGAATAALAASTLAGVASDGRGLVSLFEQAQNLTQLALMVATQVQDAGRVAAGVQVVATPAAEGYVRMLNPPSCSRCTVLAGKFYKWNTGFERHPLCDCRHVPTSEALSHDLTTNPFVYFNSLTPAEQDKAFTKDGAQAIRDGADIFKVVNARRGMHTAAINPGGSWIPKGRAIPTDVHGKPVYVTTEGTSKRGHGRKITADNGTRYRLMPESIYRLATSREEVLRLLKLYGYLL